jgi:hypothetical protein
MTDAEILEIVDQRNKDLKELVRMHSELTTAEIGALGDVLKVEMRKIQEKQDKTNGAITDHAVKITRVEEIISPQAWCKRHWKAALLLFLAGSYLIHFVIENFSIMEIIKYVK